MGGLFSRKAKKSSKDILESLENEIKTKAKSRRKNQLYERSFISYLLIVSFTIYLVGVATLYMYLMPTMWGEWLVYIVLLILFPLVVYLIKKLLNWYFSHRKAQFDQELSVLEEEKRKVLNEVMEKETYKTARELLEKYQPNHPSLRSSAQTGPNENTPSRSQLRRRVQTPVPPPTIHPSQLSSPLPSQPRLPPVTPHTTPVTPRPPPVTPRLSNTPSTPAAASSGVATNSHGAPPTPSQPVGVASNGVDDQPFIPPGMCLGAPPGPPTPCPILPRNRTNMDKMVEYLVGDGPNNRYALICRGCHSHNGMALRDEFEYMTFRCAYCYHVNLAPKTRPVLQPSSASSSKLANKNGQGGAGRRGSERRDSGDGAKGRPTIEGVSPHAQEETGVEPKPDDLVPSITA